MWHIAAIVATRNRGVSRCGKVSSRDAVEDAFFSFLSLVILQTWCSLSESLLLHQPNSAWRGLCV